MKIKKIIIAAFITTLAQVSNAQIINKSVKISSIQAGYEIFNENDTKYNSFDEFVKINTNNQNLLNTYSSSSKPNTESYTISNILDGSGAYLTADFETKNKKLFHSAKVSSGTAKGFASYRGIKYSVNNGSADTTQYIFIDYNYNANVFKLAYNFGIKSAPIKKFISFNASANLEYVQLSNFNTTTSNFFVLSYIIDNRNDSTNTNIYIVNNNTSARKRQVEKIVNNFNAGINLGTEIFLLKNMSMTVNVTTNFLVSSSNQTSNLVVNRGNFGLKFYLGR